MKNHNDKIFRSADDLLTLYLRVFLDCLPFILAVVFLFPSCRQEGNPDVRKDFSLNASWRTAENDSDRTAFNGFEEPDYNDRGWKQVNVPHNWDDYGAYRRLKHGNRHGYAWYRKTFELNQSEKDKRYFLYFEGVGSYATVWLNGDSVGYHAGGRTTFTLDVTNAIHPDGKNVLAVRADHPADIRDLPWVCGGCSPEWGFSEGSQPMGIFRPVHLVITGLVRVLPFGVHIWNDNRISEKYADLHLTTEVKNYGNNSMDIRLINKLKSAEGEIVASTETGFSLAPGTTDTLRQDLPGIGHPHLWSVDDPFLYTLETTVYEGNRILDKVETPYGIRWIKWDIPGDGATHRFLLNGKPVFINGVAEYEHMLGQSHAFSHEQIRARVRQIRAAGFNAFRDAHQPHNLFYKQKLDSLGILWWPQMAAHIWFDTPAFRKNFKQLLADWVRERRNSPSVILWGLENESSLPRDFAEECTALIRKLDPMASTQRLVTTCNGGTGTDWNVVQNWSGTYGGNPGNYGRELSSQLLNGEYGAWRSIDFHTEGGFEQKGPFSENRFDQLMETKIRLAESVRDSVCGQFFWLFASHDNPGRIQSGEGLRDLDRVGPVNYKGMFTIWGEPLDAFYLFRSNYVSASSSPMVYIVSHTWPDRWIKPGKKDSICVYSNCDEVELFNGVREHSLGKKKNPGIGNHFVWNEADIQNNVLYAVGYENGEEVAHDCIVLHHLPEADHLDQLADEVKPLIEDSALNWIYRVNCGGPDYVDSKGNLWMADVCLSEQGTWGSRSWTDNYPGLPAFYASQRRTFDPVTGTSEWPLMQTFRYGRDKLSYSFPVANGKYKVCLFFIEPWYGTGGSMNCARWRLFDVAVNDSVMIKDLDIWKEAGHDQVLKKVLDVDVTGEMLRISFPNVKSGQAVISAIAVATSDQRVKPVPPSGRLITDLKTNNDRVLVRSWMDTGDPCGGNDTVRLVSLPSYLYGADWISSGRNNETGMSDEISFKVSGDAVVYLASAKEKEVPVFFHKNGSEAETSLNGGIRYQIYQERVPAGRIVSLKIPPGKVIPFIAAVPVTSLDDAIDQRPVVIYPVEEARSVGKARRGFFAGKDGMSLNGSGDAVEWQFSVGLASKYGLEIRYLNQSGHEVKVDMSIRGTDGTLMWKGPVTLSATNEKWQSLRTDTQTTINAGTYTLKMELAEKGPVCFDFLKVQ